MKVKPEHYNHIKEEILKVHSTALQQAYTMYNISHRGYCFDLLYRAKLSAWLCSNVYVYANDDHLYTAIKHILNEVNSCL